MIDDWYIKYYFLNFCFCLVFIYFDCVIYLYVMISIGCCCILGKIIGVILYLYFLIVVIILWWLFFVEFEVIVEEMFVII